MSWHMSLIIALGKEREEDSCKFQDNLGYAVMPCLSKTKRGREGGNAM